MCPFFVAESSQRMNMDIVPPEPVTGLKRQRSGHDEDAQLESVTSPNSKHARVVQDDAAKRISSTSPPRPLEPAIIAEHSSLESISDEKSAQKTDVIALSDPDRTVLHAASTVSGLVQGAAAVRDGVASETTSALPPQDPQVASDSVSSASVSTVAPTVRVLEPLEPGFVRKTITVQRNGQSIEVSCIKKEPVVVASKPVKLKRPASTSTVESSA